MPFYTYRCENCGHQFDKHQDFSDDPLIVCPQCHKHSLRKVYFPVAVAFKGSGFYATDKGRTPPNGVKPVKAKENGKAETKSGETKNEAKGESKTEKKSEPAAKESKSEAKEK